MTTEHPDPSTIQKSNQQIQNQENQENQRNQRNQKQIQNQSQSSHHVSLQEPTAKFDYNSIETELDLSIIQKEELNKFIPKDFPMFLDNNGRIPLRRQIFQNKKILKTVLTKPKKGVYMCNHCDQIFNNLGELLDHFDEFNVKRPHKCSFDDCPWKIVGFNRIRQLQRHKISVHSTEKGFKCKIPNCNKEFARIDLLNRHIKSVHENKTSRFNRKMSKDQLNSSHSSSSSSSKSKSHHHSTSASGNISSNDESISGGEDEEFVSESNLNSQTSSKNPQIASTSTSITQDQSSESNQQRRGSKYKHTIKFLTNSDD